MAPGGVVPGEVAPTDGAVTEDDTTTGGTLPDTSGQESESGQTDTVQPGAGAAAEQAVPGADAGAVPAAP